MSHATTPIESPQSNSMAEALEKTIKRDYARFAGKPAAVMAQLPARFAHYSVLHSHKALGYRSPQQFIAAKRSTLKMGLSGFCGMITGLVYAAHSMCFLDVVDD